MIPLTDSEHALLPLHFGVDPGTDFRWGRDEFSQDNLQRLRQVEQTQHLQLLHEYLEVVKVALPDCFLDPSLLAVEDQEGYHQHPQTRPSRGGSGVVKQFGSLGKKLKKNLGKLTRNGSLNKGSSSRRHQTSTTVTNSTMVQRRVVSGSQPYIFAAFIHDDRPLPYQNEMVENYLQVLVDYHNIQYTQNDLDSYDTY